MDYLIGNISIKIHGDPETPLFEANQIIVKLLEYKKLNECRFYKDNKKNEDYVQIRQENPSGNLPPGSEHPLGWNQHSNSKIYLTEFGLYECLFISNKPFALSFRLQVMKLLKDIRLGNIKLLLQKECESTRLLAESKTSMMSYVTKLSEIEQQMIGLRQQLEHTQKRLANAQEDVFIYEIEINGKIYRGSAIDVLKRIKQHMSKSSNKHVRRAFSQGQNIQVRLIHSQSVSNRHERNHVESTFIEQIPRKHRLNGNTPRVRDPSQVSQECLQVLQQALVNPVPRPVIVERTNSRQQRVNPISNSRVQETIPLINVVEQEETKPQMPEIVNELDLTIINEERPQRGREIVYSEVSLSDHVAYIENHIIDVEFKSKIQAIKQFHLEHGITPRDSINADSFEHSLGRLLVKLRNAFRHQNTTHYELSEERYAFIKTIMPELLKDDNQAFYDRVRTFKLFLITNNRQPKQRSQNEEESQLYDWLAHRRSDFKEGKLNQTCIDFFNQQLPDFQFIVPDADQRFSNKLIALKKFIDINGRYPSQKENKLLQSFVRDIQTAEQENTKSRVKMDEKRKRYINQILPNFPW